MTKYFILILICINNYLYGQWNQISDTLHKPTYDTTSVRVQSLDYFIFCSNIYMIPRQCQGDDQSNCCVFSSEISKEENIITRGQFGCNDGTTLSWTYFSSNDATKSYVDNLLKHQVKPVNNYTIEKVNMIFCGKNVTADKVSYKTESGYYISRIITFGTINKQNVCLELSAVRELRTNLDIQQTIQEIIRFK